MATRSWSSTTQGKASAMDDAAYQRAGATVAATPAEVFAAADMIVKVKEPQAGERKMLRPRPGAVHLPASRAGSGAGGGARRKRCDLHRLRDRDVADRRPAAARADVRGGRPHGRAGGRVLPREAARRPRRAARGRAGRRSRPRSSCSAAASSARTRSTSRSAWAPTSGCSTATSTCCAGCGRSSGGRSTPCSRRATPSSGT